MQRPSPKQHLLFPTPLEAKENPTSVYSDHLPLLVSTPAINGKDPVNIVTLNVLGPSVSASGFHETGGWETDEQSTARYARIVKGLKAATAKHSVDVIALQEATPEFIREALAENFDDNWGIYIDSTVGIITLYNKKRFDLVSEQLDERNRVRHLKLKDKKNNNELTNVFNSWGLYDPFPHRMEKLITDRLHQSNQEQGIWVGDTNSRIAPVDDIPRNISTGVIPLGLNAVIDIPLNVQRSDYPDGAFYKSGNGHIVQLPTRVLHYESAEVVDDSRSAAEIQPWPEKRMILCLDHSYNNREIVANKNIFQYEDYLNKKFKENIVVRMTADSFNNKGVGLRFHPHESKLHYFLHEKFANKPGFDFKRIDSTSNEDGGLSFPTLFVELNKLPELDAIISKFRISTRSFIDDIDQQIKRISESNYGTREDKKTKIKSFNNLKNYAAKHGDKFPSDILDLWQEDAANKTDIENLSSHRHKGSLWGLLNFFTRPASDTFLDKYRIISDEEMREKSQARVR